MRPQSVAVHFDPMCPFAYATSVWLRDVRAQTGLALEWRFFSSAADQQTIVEALRPYLAGRDWVSIDRGEVIEFPADEENVS